jgi:phospholipid transport system substrate-binding protein
MFARLLATVLCLGLGLALPAAASSEPPGVLIERVSTDVLKTLQDSASKPDRQAVMALVQEKVLPHFDFTRMTALATGLGWRSASAEQQGQLVDQFRTLLVRTYSTALTRYTNQTLEFQPARFSEDQKKSIVRSLLKQPGAPVLTIDYRMALLASGEWKIYDVTVDGVSLVTTYRDSFAEEVRARGIDGLIKMLVAKNGELAAKQG